MGSPLRRSLASELVEATITGLLCGVWFSCCFQPVLDFGTHVDGPGLGLWPERSRWGLFPWLLCVVSLVGVFWIQRKSARASMNHQVDWRPLLPGLAACFAVLGAFVYNYRALLAFVWNRRCDAGEEHACWAAGGLYHGGLGVRVDLTRTRQLYHRSCELADNKWHTIGCFKLLELSRGSEHRWACERMEALAHCRGKSLPANEAWRCKWTELCFPAQRDDPRHLPVPD